MISLQTRRPILLTGSHRSGSTWVGKILAGSQEVGYINEPFNLSCRAGVCDMPVTRWFEYVTAENESGFYEGLRSTFDFSYNLRGEIKTLSSLRDAACMARDWSAFLCLKARNARPLMKDPLAFFSAEWIADRFNADVVVLVRHPAAFASSLKRVNWAYPFCDLLEQRLLMERMLSQFEPEIRRYAEYEQPVVDQAAFLWRMIYDVAAQYRESRPNWIFVRHEDLSLEPIDTFRALFADLELDFTPRVERLIRRSTQQSNPNEAPEGATQYLKRNSRANVWNWKSRLTPDEISSIRNQVGEVSRMYYSDKDW